MLIDIPGKRVKGWVLTMSDRPDRRNNITRQLECAGEDPTEYEYRYATRFPFNRTIAEALTRTGEGRFTKPCEYDCARNHYDMARISLDLGYDYSVVLEDDVRLMRGQALRDMLSSLPDDFDLLQMAGFSASQTVSGLSDEGCRWVLNDRYPLWTTGMYALSRRGMEYYVAFMERRFCVADMPLYLAPRNLKVIRPYVSSVPLAIQADKDACASDIRDASNDRIDYATQNAYESRINKTDGYYPYQDL